MWELIQRNKQKSFLLFVTMGACLLLLGYVIGEAFGGAFFGMSIAFVVWFFLSLIGYFSGDQILLSVSHAKEVTENVHPQLFNVVDEMRIAANLNAMPKIYIIDEFAPNAFATGRNPEKSAIAITVGLLSKLNRDELQGVVAHEMSHVMNRDVLFMTFAGIMLGSIVLISDLFLRGGRYSIGSSRRYRSSENERGGQGQALIIIIALLFAILAPLLARLLYFAISRNREYLADASGVRLTRYPEGLARALEKISNSNEELTSANQVTAPMYIVNPFRETVARFTGLMSTHPPIEKRIQILRQMMHSADYSSYQKAYSSVTGQSTLLPPSALKENEAVPVKKASEAEPVEPKSIKEEMREAGDLTRAVNRFAFLTCVCGLKIKIPPDFKKPNIICPRCWHALANPLLQTTPSSN